MPSEPMHVSLSPGIQLDVVHVEEVADDCFTVEPLSTVTLVMMWLRGFRSVTLIDTTLDVNLCNWLEISFQDCSPIEFLI